MASMDGIRPPRQPWERMDDPPPGESEKAFEAFCLYLQLAKRGTRTQDGKPRRFMSDLVEKHNIPRPSAHSWYNAWNWEERAEAYDLYMANDCAETAALATIRDFAEELRFTGRTLRSKATKFIEENEIQTFDEAIKLQKLGVDLEKAANQIKKPNEEEQKKAVLERIAQHVEYAAGLGILVGGAIGGVRAAAQSADSGGRTGQVIEGERGSVQPVPGELAGVCEGSSREDMGAEHSPDREGGRPEDTEDSGSGSPWDRQN
jgi:hypothetical protein